jgi:hypothetical protein
MWGVRAQRHDLAAASVFLNQIPNGLRHSLNRKVPAMTAVTLPACKEAAAPLAVRQPQRCETSSSGLLRGACRGLVGSGQMIMSGVSCSVGPGRTLEIVRTVRLCREGVRLVQDGALLRAALLSRLMSKVNRVGDGCRSKFAPSGGTIRCACGRCDCRRTLSYQTQVSGRAHRMASAAGQWRVGR